MIKLNDHAQKFYLIFFVFLAIKFDAADYFQVQKSLS